MLVVGPQTVSVFGALSMTSQHWFGLVSVLSKTDIYLCGLYQIPILINMTLPSCYDRGNISFIWIILALYQPGIYSPHTRQKSILDPICGWGWYEKSKKYAIPGEHWNRLWRSTQRKKHEWWDKKKLKRRNGGEMG